jgi:hypothetical protein
MFFMTFILKVSLKVSLDAIFIALIPKEYGVMDIKEFRPISHVSGVHKIISKVLPNELKTVLEKVISRS